MKTSYKLFIAGATTLPILGLAGTAFASQGTNGNGFGDNFASKFAERFNVDKGEVSSFMNQQHEEREAQREAKVSEALKTAGFSDEQTTALRDKKEAQHEAMETWRDANPNATREEMKARRDADKTEFETWATGQGIDIAKVREALQSAMPMGGHGKGGRGQGEMMMNGPATE